MNFNEYTFDELESMLASLEKETDRESKKKCKEIDLYLCLHDNLRYEKKYYSRGYDLIAGVDEVGRGPLVGPVVAAAVILPKNYKLEGLTDSKKLSEKKRDYFYNIILADALAIGIGIINNDIIDDINIYEATKLAMKDAINKLNVNPDIVLTDAMNLDIDTKVVPIIKGDLKSITIAAASVVAKVTRDRMMYELDKKYPYYNFKNNKGYPTRDHIEAIEKYGIIREHRKTYNPIKSMNL